MSCYFHNFVWEGKLKVEGGFWKLMIPCHPSLTQRTRCPSSNSAKRTASRFVAADLLFDVKRRKHGKTCGGDQKDSSSNSHFDYLKQRSS